MPSGISSIALLTPIVASNAVFSARRATKGVDNLSENPAYGVMNMDIAAGQTFKGTKAAMTLASAGEGAGSAMENIKKVSNSNKFFKGASKIINFTADHINPIICATSGIKVLTADDKVDEASRETLALSAMFGAEACAKRFVGMPYTKKVEGKNVTFERKGLYKKLLSEKQNQALEDFIKTKHSMKYLAGGAKGLMFVGASITGYKLGNMIADYILGERKKSNAAA